MVSKIIFPVLFTLVIFGCGSLQSATKEDFSQMNAVISVKMKKGDTYDKIMKWVTTKYNSPKTVMQYCDKPTGLISFNGAFRYSDNPLYSYSMEYKVVVNIKDDKYKIEMSPVQWTYSAKGQVGNYFSKDMAVEYNKEFVKVRDDMLKFVSGNSGDDF